MYTSPLKCLCLFILCWLNIAQASSGAFIAKPYHEEINTFLQIQPPMYININQCLHIESKTSWETLQEIASKINYWHRFEVNKDDRGLYFSGDICK